MKFETLAPNSEMTKCKLYAVVCGTGQSGDAKGIYLALRILFISFAMPYSDQLRVFLQLHCHKGHSIQKTHSKNTLHYKWVLQNESSSASYHIKKWHVSVNCKLDAVVCRDGQSGMLMEFILLLGFYLLVSLCRTATYEKILQTGVCDSCVIGNTTVFLHMK